VATQTSEEIGVDRQLLHLVRSPIRVKALSLLMEGLASPKEISVALKIPLTSACHHVRELLKMGLIELVDKQPRRGSVEHFYRAVIPPRWTDDQWAELSLEERQRLSTWVVQLMTHDVAVALHGGTFCARSDTHGSRALPCVDEQGRREVNQILDRALEAILEVGEAASERLADSEEEPLHLRTVMLCIDMPRPESLRDW
jgi:DNA-binding transcriptional ArsR family regulator